MRLNFVRNIIFVKYSGSKERKLWKRTAEDVLVQYADVPITITAILLVVETQRMD